MFGQRRWSSFASIRNDWTDEYMKYKCSMIRRSQAVVTKSRPLIRKEENFFIHSVLFHLSSSVCCFIRIIIMREWWSLLSGSSSKREIFSLLELFLFLLFHLSSGHKLQLHLIHSFMQLHLLSYANSFFFLPVIRAGLPFSIHLIYNPHSNFSLGCFWCPRFTFSSKCCNSQ